MSRPILFFDVTGRDVSPAEMTQRLDKLLEGEYRVVHDPSVAEEYEGSGLMDDEEEPEESVDAPDCEEPGCEALAEYTVTANDNARAFCEEHTDEKREFFGEDELEVEEL